MSETYEVLALKYGFRESRTRKDSFIFDDALDLPHKIDYFVWLIRNENRTILVDTGYDYKEGLARGREITMLPREALAKLDVDAETLSDVIVTHLHYDHAGTLDDFPAANFHLQDAEMEYATGRCMCHDHLREPFTADHICSMIKKVYTGKARFHDGDAEVAPGVTVHKIGGHSKGLQSVRVMTESGPLVLASDAAHFYENYEKKKPFPIVANLEEMLEGYNTLTTMADGDSSRVVPGHDPLVCEHYQPYSSATDGLVYKLG